MSLSNFPGPAAGLHLHATQPWPGLEAYDEGSADYFKGRDDKAQELLRKLRSAPLTLLYGKSGLGKSSLLQAGLFPLLRQHHFLPVYVRLDASSPDGGLTLAPVLSKLLEQLRERNIEHPEPNANESLWTYLHRRDAKFWSHDSFQQVPVLVFDQFEELFSRGVGNLDALVQELGDLIEGRIPSGVSAQAEVTELVRANAGSGPLVARKLPRPRETDLDFFVHRYRVVLSFREDFLADVQALERRIPSLFLNYLRLEPMQAKVAEAALLEAGHAVLDADVARGIVRFVGRREGADHATSDEQLSIEPVLLSLCCYELNRRRPKDQKISLDLLGATGDTILDDFYSNALADKDVAGEPDVQGFIETKLIQGDRFRGDYPVAGALQESLISPKQLKALTTRHRILRVVAREDTPRIELIPDQPTPLTTPPPLLLLVPPPPTPRVELIHDRLVPAVCKPRDQRRLEAQKRNEERAAALARKDLAAEQERTKVLARSRRLEHERALAYLALAAVAILGIFVVSAGWGWLRVREKKRNLDQQRVQAISKQQLAASVALRTSALAARRVALQRQGDGAGDDIDPVEQIALRSLAAYRLGDVLNSRPARISSLLALHRFVGEYAQLRSTLRPSTFKPAGGLAFSPDGYTIAVGGDDGIVHLLDALTLHEKARLDCGVHDDAAWTLAFASEGDMLAVGFANYSAAGAEQPSGAICLFDVNGGKVLRHWKIESEAGPPDIYSIAWGGPSDEPFLVSGSSDHQVLVWDPRQDAPRERLRAASPVSAVAAAPSGEIALGDENGVVSVRSRDGRDMREVGTHEKVVQSLTFWPSDPTRLTSVGNDGHMKTWNVARRCLIQDSQGTLPSLLSLTMPRKAEGIAVGAMDGSVRLFKLKQDDRKSSCASQASSSLYDDMEPISAHPGPVWGVAINPEGDSLVSVGDEGLLRVWGFKHPGGALAHLLDASSITSLAIEPERLTIVAGDKRGQLYRWDGLRLIQTTNPHYASFDAQWSAHDGPIRDLAFTRIHGEWVLLSAGDDGRIRSWNPDTWSPIGNPWRTDGEPVTSLAISPSEGQIAAGSERGTIRVWAAAEGLVEKTIEPPEADRSDARYHLEGLGFTSDGRFLARSLRGKGTNKIRADLLAVGTSNEVAGMSPYHQLMRFARGSDGAPWLLSITEGGELLVWERNDAAARTEPKLTQRMGFESRTGLSALSASASGAVTVTAGARGLVRLWETSEEGALIGESSVGDQDVNIVAMAPDEQFFVTAVNDSMMVWAGPARWADIVCSRLSHNMSRAQWKAWLSAEVPYQKQCPNLPILPDSK